MPSHTLASSCATLGQCTAVWRTSSAAARQASRRRRPRLRRSPLKNELYCADFWMTKSISASFTRSLLRISSGSSSRCAIQSPMMANCNGTSQRARSRRPAAAASGGGRRGAAAATYVVRVLVVRDGVDGGRVRARVVALERLQLVEGAGPRGRRHAPLRHHHVHRGGVGACAAIKSIRRRGIGSKKPRSALAARRQRDLQRRRGTSRRAPLATQRRPAEPPPQYSPQSVPSSRIPPVMRYEAAAAWVLRPPKTCRTVRAVAVTAAPLRARSTQP